MKDHLGSIRVTVDEDGEIAGYDDYDPWGLVLRGSLSISDARYKFTGKERDVETGYDYFGARRSPKDEGGVRGIMIQE